MDITDTTRMCPWASGCIVKAAGGNKGQISDGLHTFDDLYAHRIALFKALCWQIKQKYHSTSGVVWRSRRHSDGSSYPGWFVLGIFTEAGDQITYHLPESEWNSCDFAEIRWEAPEFDGHTSKDVLDRLSNL